MCTPYPGSAGTHVAILQHGRMPRHTRDHNAVVARKDWHTCRTVVEHGPVAGKVLGETAAGVAAGQQVHIGIPEPCFQLWIAGPGGRHRIEFEAPAREAVRVPMDHADAALSNLQPQLRGRARGSSTRLPAPHAASCSRAMIAFDQATSGPRGKFGNRSLRQKRRRCVGQV